MSFAYDQLSVLRYLIPHSKRILSLEDLIYWLAMAAQLFYLLFTYHRGEIRSYIIVGLIAGNFIYSKTIRPVYLAVMRTLLHPIEWLFSKIFRNLKKKPSKLKDKH